MPGAARRGVCPGVADEVHQAGAGPPSGYVEAFALHFRALRPIAGQLGEDEAGIELPQFLVGHAETLLLPGQKIGEDDVGALHQPMQHRLASGPSEVQANAALVAGG